jgi:hypothetical protein
VPHAFKRNLVVLFFAFAFFTAPAQTPKNNLQAILQLFDRVAYRIAELVSRDGLTAIWVKSPANLKPEERFLFSRLVTVLSDSLRLSIYKNPLDSIETTTLIYHLHRCEIVYRPLPRKIFWQGSRWQRVANVMIEVDLYNTSTRQVVSQKIFEESAADTLSEKSWQNLENRNLSFTVGRTEPDEAGWRWLEPVLIVSATGAVIYLFYSLRSR